MKGKSINKNLFILINYKKESYYSD